MLFDSLIFDLDGTLWDTTESCAQGWNAALAEAGISRAPVTGADMASIMGLVHRQIFARVFPDLSDSLHELLAPLCYRHEEEAIRRLGGRLYPGVAELVPRLAQDWPLFIVSNCQVGYVEMFLELSGWSAHFQDFECHGNTGLSKGENLGLVVERNQLQRPIYLGDTPGDQEAACQAGIPFLFAAYGFGSCERYLARLGSFGELEGYLEATGRPTSLDCLPEACLDAASAASI